MDPSAAVQRLRELSQAIDSELNADIVSALAEEMASVWDGLDEWIMRGGFPPRDWALPLSRALKATD